MRKLWFLVALLVVGTTVASAQTSYKPTGNHAASSNSAFFYFVIDANGQQLPLTVVLNCTQYGVEVAGNGTEGFLKAPCSTTSAKLANGEWSTTVIFSDSETVDLNGLKITVNPATFVEQEVLVGNGRYQWKVTSYRLSITVQ